jgi:hypothetical protein
MDEANLSDARAAFKFRGVKVKGGGGDCLWIQELVMDEANPSDARAALKFRGVKVKGWELLIQDLLWTRPTLND